MGGVHKWQHRHTQIHTDTDTKANIHKMCVKRCKEFSNGIKAAWDPCVLLQKTLGLALDHTPNWWDLIDSQVLHITTWPHSQPHKHRHTDTHKDSMHVDISYVWT